MSGPNTAKVDGERSTQVKVTISKDGMTATLIVRSPSRDEAPVGKDEIMRIVRDIGIVHGLDEKAIDRVLAQNLVNQAIIIASGTIPKRGNPSQFEYHFNTSSEFKPHEDERGHIDYKNIDFIQSVSEGDLLVTKIPATPGTSGKTVYGKELRAPSGPDLPFKKGHNTRVSEDGLELLAASDGVIFYTNGIVAVKDVTVINGDIDFNIGNIDSKASVQIHGDVKTGFSVKTTGDIQVNGMVEDCYLSAGGNIFVSGGIFGSGEGEIRAEGDITAKFVENYRLHAGGNITLGEAAVNSRLSAHENVRVTSKNGRIVGGTCEAGSSIHVAISGAPAGTSTVLKMVVARELMNARNEIKQSIERLTDDARRVGDAVSEMMRLQESGQLATQKQLQLQELIKIHDSFPEQIESLEQKRDEIDEMLGNKTAPFIKVDRKIHAGTIIRFDEAQQTILEESQGGLFQLADGTICFRNV